MSYRLALLCPLLSLALAPLPARAQVCTGFAGLHDTPVQVGAGAAFNSDAFGFGASVTAGKELFGSVGIGSTHIDALDGSSLDLNIGGGYDFSVEATRRAFLCPAADFQASFGPNDIFGTGVDLRTIGFSFGLHFGGVATQTPQFQLIPAGGLFVAYIDATFEDDAGNTASQSDTYGVFRAGLGFVINRVFTVQPALVVPFGLEGSEVSFGIGVAINFGRRR